LEASSTVLVVDDERAARFALRRALEKEHRVLEAESGEQALAVVARERPDLVVLDLNMPGIGGLATLDEIGERPDPPPVLILTAHGSERIAVDAMKRGAADYLPKPYDIEELRLVARRTIERRELERENGRLKTALRASAGLGELLGESEPMRRVLEVLARVAPLDATVLIEGESGTGKELVAREIHRRSPRAPRPFVALNCAALPEGLVESELFGHERGAFTGAALTRKGRFELAHEGTLFLDEVGEAPATLQAKLLRVLESRRFERVGGAETREANVRLIAATNRDLKAQVAAGKFREDLYYRLKVIDLRLPPLRARAADIPLLARHFTEIAGTKYGIPARPLSRAALAALCAYPWPGNVRELAHVLEKTAILASGPQLELTDLPPDIAAAVPLDLPPLPPESPAAPPAPVERASGGGPVATATPSSSPHDEPSHGPGPRPGPDGTTSSVEPAEEELDVALDAAAAAGAALAAAETEGATPFAEAKRRAMVRFETALITRELVRSRGNVSQTARALGLHRQSLQHKLRELGIDAEQFRDRLE
jgi:DNA-binding NtrC family response regulator